MNSRRNILSILGIWALLSMFPVSGLVSPLSEGHDAKSGTEETHFDAWVAFKNKGPLTETERLTAFRELERSYPARALERRKKRRTFPGLFDDRDLPLAREYLEAVAGTGARLMGQSRWMNGTAVQATQGQIDLLRALPCVKDVLHPRQRTRSGSRASGPEEVPVEPEPQEENLSGFYGRSGLQVQQLGLDRLHSAGFTGKGIVIAVVDTAFDLSHPAFNHPDHPIRAIDRWDAMDNDGETSREPHEHQWEHRHGTYVLGTIAAYLPGELVGTAYDASFILIRAEDDVEEYFMEEYWFVMALEYAESHSADIITSSLTLYTGYGPEDMDGRTSVMARGWEIAAGNGIIGIAGAGNAGHDSDPTTSHLGVPADAHSIIAVGAVLPDGSMARFSSDGPTRDGRLKPELLALGYPVWTVSIRDPGRFYSAAGTSVAGPLIAGGLACLLQAHPEWTTEKLFEALFESGDVFLQSGQPDPLSVRGYGIPDFFLASGLKKE